MAAPDYVSLLFKKPLASRGASTDEYSPRLEGSIARGKALSKPVHGLPIDAGKSA